MLLVQEFLHAFLLVVSESSTADLIHEEQDCFVSVPQVLLSQNSHPKLQNCSSSDTVWLQTFHHMTLKTSATSYFRYDGAELLSVFTCKIRSILIQFSWLKTC